MSYLDRVRALHAWDPAAYRPFMAGGRQVGLIHRDFVPHLADFGAVFRVTGDAVAMDPDPGSPAARTTAMAGVLGEWRGLVFSVVAMFLPIGAYVIMHQGGYEQGRRDGPPMVV